jgi:anti-sigma regulatory factor (Ser/Thr protein kinase)
MRYQASFPAVRTSALSARRFVADTVGDVPEEVSESVALIASELATNCVRHATASAFEIRVERLADRIVIEVEDDGAGDPVVRSPGPGDTSGRGLQIVSALADDWGVIPAPTSTGKTVWAAVILRASEGDRRDASRRDETDGSPGAGPRRQGTGTSGTPTILGAGSGDPARRGALLLDATARWSEGGRRWEGRSRPRPASMPRPHL